MMVTQNYGGKETDLLLLWVSILQKGSLTVCHGIPCGLDRTFPLVPPLQQVYRISGHPACIYPGKGTVVPVHGIKTFRGAANGPLILDRCSREKCEWSTACHGHFTAGTHWTACWVGTRVGLKSFEEHKILLPLPRNERLVIQHADWCYPDSATWLLAISLAQLVTLFQFQ